MNYTHPFNLLTLAAGLALLVAGSVVYPAPDWDIPISFIMAGFAYLFAAWSVSVVVFRRWRAWPAMLLATWWTVDGCYSVYWWAADPVALDLMRDVNWPASLVLYWTCGLIWSLGSSKALFHSGKASA